LGVFGKKFLKFALERSIRYDCFQLNSANINSTEIVLAEVLADDPRKAVRMKGTRTTFWLATMVGLLFAGNASAATFVVNSTASGTSGAAACTAGQPCTFEDAVEAANASPDVDTIDATGVSGTVILTGSAQINQPADIIGSGLVIDGAGTAVFRISASGVSVSGFEFVNTAGVVIEGSATLANSVIRDAQGTAGLIVNTLDPVTITNNRVYGTVGSFELLLQGNGHVVDGNVFGIDDSGSVGTAIYGAIMTRVANLTFTNNSVAGTLDAVFARGISDSSFVKNRMGDFNGSVGNGGSRYGLHLNSTSNIVLEGNLTNGHAQDGLIITSSSNVSVFDHISSDNGQHGIFVGSGATASVQGAVLSNNATGFAAVSPGTVFSQGSVSANATIGIDVGADGPTANGGADTFTDSPVLDAATGGTSLSVDGSLTEAPGTVFDLEFYESDACGNGNGERFLGSISIVVGASGVEPFTANFATAVAPGKFLTATATGPNGTSEFGNCIEVIPGAQPEANVEFYKLNRWVLNTNSWKPLIGLFLGTADQDVDDIDLFSLRLGNAPASVAIYADINRDGRKDLIVAFIGRHTGCACGDTEIELTGELAGVPFTEVLGIRLVGCNGASKGKKKGKKK
jgi:hypothetical protein